TNLKKQHRTDFTKLAQYDLTTSKEITIPEKEPDPKTAPAAQSFHTAQSLRFCLGFLDKTTKP
ncbi:MAG: hypothetical protein ACFCUI_13105, partial [Bernardetiaceae bacterium]